MIAHEPVDTIEIGGRTLKVDLIDPAKLKACNIIGQALRIGAYTGEEVPHAVATILACMVEKHHPAIRPCDLVGDLTYLHFVQTANELARQLLLSLPAQRMGTA